METAGLQAVLWDLDGTILDSDPLWGRAEAEMLARYGIEYTDEIRDMLIGSGLWDAAERFRELGVELSADEIVAEWVEHVGPAIGRGEAEWRPGARELIGSLRGAGIPCALVTMSVRSLADRVLALLPPGSFAVVIAGDEVAWPKPHPEPYLLAAAALGVSIERCVVIEDSPTGIHAGNASGAVTIGVPNMVSLREAPAHALWSTLEGRDAQLVRDEYSRLALLHSEE